jgi:hypothetical protein
MYTPINERLTIWEIVLEDGSTFRRVMTPRQLAGFKRSKDGRKAITRRKIGEVSLTIKLA